MKMGGQKSNVHNVMWNCVLVLLSSSTELKCTEDHLTIHCKKYVKTVYNIATTLLNKYFWNNITLTK
jgi:hypothetical protein